MKKDMPGWGRHLRRRPIGRLAGFVGIIMGEVRGDDDAAEAEEASKPDDWVPSSS